MNNLEIILLALLVLLTIVIILVSWQVFFFFKRLRQDLDKAEAILNQLDLATQRLLLPMVDLGLAWRFLTHSGRLFKIIDKLIDKNKNAKSQRS